MRLIFLTVILFSLSVSGQKLSEKRLQELYYHAVENEDSTELLYKETASISNSASGIYLGYKAMANMLMAQYAWFPTSKLEYFNTGKQLLNEAIKNDPKNIELRFFRYSSQKEAPSFLSYNKNLQEDKLYIIKYFSSVKSALVRQKIREYMLWKCSCTETEKKIFY